METRCDKLTILKPSCMAHLWAQKTSFSFIFRTQIKIFLNLKSESWITGAGLNQRAGSLLHSLLKGSKLASPKVIKDIFKIV